MTDALDSQDGASLLPPSARSPIADSIELSKAAESTWQVIVVGGGVAGTCAAAALATQGVRVLLLDKGRAPRNKTCGCCMNLRAVRGLHRLGLKEVLDALAPREIHGMHIIRGNTSAAIPFPIMKGIRPIAVSRIALDHALLSAAISRGAHFLGETRVVSTTHEVGRRVVRVRAPEGRAETLHAEVVLACDGLGSTLAREAELDLPQLERGKIGASAVFPEGAFRLPADKITMATGDLGYAGVVQLEDGTWNVAAALHADSLKDGVSQVIAQLLRECAIGAPDLTATKWTTCPRLGREVTRPWAERMLLAGDSSGYIEPITGEGMAWAIAAAESAAACASEPWNSGTGRAYERDWNRRVASSRKAVMGASRILDRGWVAERAIKTLGAMPSMGEALGRALNQDPQ